jgi:hypothetical protein
VARFAAKFNGGETAESRRSYRTELSGERVRRQGKGAAELLHFNGSTNTTTAELTAHRYAKKLKERSPLRRISRRE